MKQKFNWNTSMDGAEEVLEGVYDEDRVVELTKTMTLELNNCVEITPQEKASPEIRVH